MEVPIRCFTCGKVLGNKFEKFEELKKNGKSAKEAMDTLGITRICCRQIMLCYVDLGDKISEYQDCKIGITEKK